MDKYKKEHLEACIQYIIDHESEDFEENPSESHVYFSAVAFRCGLDEARQELKQAIFDQLKPRYLDPKSPNYNPYRGL